MSPNWRRRPVALRRSGKTGQIGLLVGGLIRKLRSTQADTLPRPTGWTGDDGASADHLQGDRAPVPPALSLPADETEGRFPPAWDLIATPLSGVSPLLGSRAATPSAATQPWRDIASAHTLDRQMNSRTRKIGSDRKVGPGGPCRRSPTLPIAVRESQQWETQPHDERP